MPISKTNLQSSPVTPGATTPGQMKTSHGSKNVEKIFLGATIFSAVAAVALACAKIAGIAISASLPVICVIGGGLSTACFVTWLVVRLHSIKKLDQSETGAVVKTPSGSAGYAHNQSSARAVQRRTGRSLFKPRTKVN